MADAVKGKQGLAKARLLITLFSREQMSKNEITASFTKQTSKGVYRHLRDLESEKIIKTVNSKGSLTICKLNKNLNSLAKFFDYSFVYTGIKEAFDRAFAECFTSPLGDFLYAYFQEFTLTEEKWYMEPLDVISDSILNEGKRPYLNEEQMITINRVAYMLRGYMNTTYKLAYISFVRMLYNIPKDEFYTELVFTSSALNFKKDMITIIQGKQKDSHLANVRAVYEAAREILIMSVDMMNEGKEVHFLGPVTDKEKLVGRIITRTLSLQNLTINDFLERSPKLDAALKDFQSEL